MKPAARIQSAIEILDSVFEGKRPADVITTDYFKARRYAGSKDRRSINDRVYSILRSRARLGWLAEKTGIAFSARHLVLLNCIQNEEDIEALFTGEQYAPDTLSHEEKAILLVLAEFDMTQAPASVRLEYPDWLEKELKTSLGDHFEAALQALNEEAPLDLRINALHEDKNNAADLLAKQNIETEAGQYSPYCLRTKKKVKLGGIKAYKDGLIDIQDEGSQLIALLTNTVDQELVIDFCAGAGGKTLAMAADMKNQGHLYALDISEKRLYKMRRRLERAKITNVILNPIKAENDPWLKQFESRADRVLIDAPCSGIGAWRRNPESRWKLTQDLVDDMVGRQQRILQTAAHLVKPGGRLVYATCSILKRENEDQVETFLKENNNYAIVPLATAWAERFKTACPFTGDYMSMRPDLHKSDGFFCAVLERVK